MAVGDIIAASVETHAGSGVPFAKLTFDDFSTGGTHNYGWGADNAATAAVPYILFDSPGYDENGNATTQTDEKVYLTRVMRQAFPNEATLDESVSAGDLISPWSLSDFIYADATNLRLYAPANIINSGGNASGAASGMAMTNGSSNTHASCVGRWLTVPFQRVSGAFTVRRFAMHRSARNAKPVACVTMSCTDGTTTVSQNATLVTYQEAVTGLYVTCYQSTFNTADFTQGATLTINAVEKPWVGSAAAILDTSTGTNPPAAVDGPLKFLCDKTGAYGTTYCVVDPVGGSAGGTAAASEAAAALTPVQTITQAVTAIKAFNLANYARNTADAGEVCLVDGNHAGLGTITGGNSSVWCTIRPVTGGVRATTIINTATNLVQNGYFRYQNVSLSTAGTGPLRGSSVTGALWLDRVIFNLTGTGTIYSWASVYVTGIEVTAASSGSFSGFSTNFEPVALFLGNKNNHATSRYSADGYAFLGNDGFVPNMPGTGNTQGHPIADNSVQVFNRCLSTTGRFYFQIFTTTTITVGIATGCNLCERITDDTQPLEQIAGDAQAAAVANVIQFHNTFAGQRSNLGYNDAGATGYIMANWTQKFCAFEQWNNKDDTFAPGNAARVGAWPVGYGYGFLGSRIQESNFPGEFDGVDTAYTTDQLYVDDQSVHGGGAGNGDYAPSTSSPLRNRVPQGKAVITADLYGTLYRNDGSDAAGAINTTETTRASRPWLRKRPFR